MALGSTGVVNFFNRGFSACSVVEDSCLRTAKGRDIEAAASS